MVLLELFSGIGGFSKGLEAAGYTFDKVYFSEIDKHAVANFKYNFPYAEHIGTVTEITNAVIERPDIITFGSPCQNFSIAGDGTGLQGKESSLIRYAVEAVRKFRPDVFIWENVKGVLFSKHRNDFWSIIQAFTHIGGYRLEWQLFNTAWFLPQNRERIYLVGRLAKKCTGDVFPFPAPGGMHGSFGKDATAASVCGTITKNYGKQPNIGNYVLCLKPGDVYNGKLTPDQIKGIRMLTEVECERLQGFPDDFTKYGKYEKETKIIPRVNRYALLGNAVSVPVVKAVAARIKKNTAIV